MLAPNDYLIARLALGDASAFSELTERWRGKLISYFSQRTFYSLDFEHLAGLVFDKVVRYAPRYVAKDRFTSWLFAIAKGVLLDELKRYRREREREGLSWVTKHGSKGSQARNRVRNERSDEPESWSASGGEVVDVSFHTRSVDVSLRFRPEELRRKGYGIEKELRSMFRKVGLVDGPTPDLWKKVIPT